MRKDAEFEKNATKIIPTNWHDNLFINETSKNSAPRTHHKNTI